LDFESVRKYAINLNLNYKKQWDKLWNSNQLQSNIPQHPDAIYADAGWKSWGNWLGSNYTKTFLRKYKKYEEAKKFVVQLKLEGHTQWKRYINDEYPEKPILSNLIPRAPHIVYKNKGWIVWVIG